MRVNIICTGNSNHSGLFKQSFFSFKFKNNNKHVNSVSSIKLTYCLMYLYVFLFFKFKEDFVYKRSKVIIWSVHVTFKIIDVSYIDMKYVRTCQYMVQNDHLLFVKIIEIFSLILVKWEHKLRHYLGDGNDYTQYFIVFCSQLKWRVFIHGIIVWNNLCFENFTALYYPSFFVFILLSSSPAFFVLGCNFIISHKT